jgi:hypothetical protein
LIRRTHARTHTRRARTRHVRTYAQELAAAGSTAAVKVSVGCLNSTACLSLDSATVALLESEECGLVVVAAGLTWLSRVANDAEAGGNACGCPDGA